MTPMMVGDLMRKARKLLQTKAVTLRDIAILDTLLFRCRAPGTAKTSVSLTRLATLAGCCKDTVIAALQRLHVCGLIRKEHRRVKVDGLWRQATNIYEFLAPARESTTPPAYREQASFIPDSPLEKALTRLRGLNYAVDLPD
jgi:hypothetical protein